MPHDRPQAAATSNPLTLIVTTSPTPSAPSTDLLSAVFRSFESNCPALLSCPLIVVFDNYDHIVPRSRLKKGQVTPEGARNYETYKKNVKDLVCRTYLVGDEGPYVKSEEPAEFGSPRTAPVSLFVSATADGRVKFVECSERLGFGLAVRSALRIASTPFVWVHQHDWTLECAIPLPSILDVMQASEHEEIAPIGYVCLPSQRMMEYATSMHVEMFPKLKDLTSNLRRNFPSLNGPPVPLTPLFFWHDKPHICNREHYLKRVFPSRLAIARGMFIEDSVGHRARDQMKDGLWSKWASWLYIPGEGRQVCVRHLHGRVWKGDEQHQEQIGRWREEGRRRAEEVAPTTEQEADSDDEHLIHPTWMST